MSKKVSFLTHISRVLAKDPYTVGRGFYVSYFHWKKTYTTATDMGFLVRYTLFCAVTKIDSEEFRNAQMLDEDNQQRLVDEWHTEFFLPRFRELKYCFKYLCEPFPKALFWNPCACRIIEEEGEKYIVADPGAYELTNEARALPPLRRNGCVITFFDLSLHSDSHKYKDESLIEENYAMIKTRTLNSAENQPAYRIMEEVLVTTLWKKQIDLERELQKIQAIQEYKSDAINVTMRTASGVIELEWKVEQGEFDCMFQGYRNAGEGFRSGDGRLESNGKCIIETRSCAGKAFQNLALGEEHFFSFFLTREMPVYEELKFPDSVFKSPRLVRKDTVIVDSLRFSVRMPTRLEIARVEQLLERAKTEPVDPRREKINRAFEELSSFVEFDESLTQWEDHFLKQIEGKDYPLDEKRDKIEKLKSVVEALRIQSMP